MTNRKGKTKRKREKIVANLIAINPRISIAIESKYTT